MKRLLCVLFLLLAWESAAQLNPLEEGDPPVASLISISPPDETGVVTISGSAGAVFPAAQVAIQNLYTQDIVYTAAGITGSFSATIYGPGNTPFWISPSPTIPNDLRNRPGSLPGGSGTIIYGPPPEAITTALPVTQLIMDGALDDWDAYPDATLDEGVLALANDDSLYAAIDATVSEGSRLVVLLTLDNTTYEIALDPFLPQTALLRQITPVEQDLGTLAVAAATADSTVELRIPLEPLDDEVETATLNRIFTRDEDGEDGDDIQILDAAIPLVAEQDGIVFPGGPRSGNLTRFSVGGAVAQGASRWNATGRIETLALSPGDETTLEMDITLTVPDLAESLVGLQLIGEIGLQPVVADIDGLQNIPALHSNNGWSSNLTPSGLAVDNLRGDIPLNRVTIPAPQVVRRGDQLLTGFRFALALPDDLPAGLYVLVFRGSAQVGDGDIFAWEDNGLFGMGEGIGPMPLARLPLVLNVGNVEDAPLLWTLFYDDPSDGSRGVLSAEDQTGAALSNRVRFNSPSYVLPPGEYPIEPYLLNLMPNNYDLVTAPLLPLLFPGGRLKATITRPDGQTDDLADAPFTQNRLSTATVDERDIFGAQVPVDAYRLTTNSPDYQGYSFDQYGEYEITLTGSIEDIYGNRYTGGGTYRLTIAEPLDLTPGVLPGSPFQVGDAFFSGGQIAPGLPAEVDVTVTVYGLDGSADEQSVGTVANEHGYFAVPGEGLIFEQAGEYIIDYDARFEDDEGILWAASLRGAGVIASPDTPLVAHGVRGLPQREAVQNDDFYRPAWFTTTQYAPDSAEAAILPHPYHIGDVATIPDGAANGIGSALRAQDTSERYGEWLTGTIPDYSTPAGVPIQELVALDELPLLPVLGGPQTIYSPVMRPELVVNDAYTYISAVRPAVTVQQMVLGHYDEALPLYWDNDSPLNRQIGAGINGNRPGDYIFLFGGAVLRNAELNLNETAAYAALAVVADEDAAPQIYPPYRGSAGGPDGGPLLAVDEQAVDMFFLPTGVRPAQVLDRGDVFAIAGQAAPTLPTVVTVRLTAPDGTLREFEGLSSPTGYFYDPEANFNVDQAGLWNVEIITTPAGPSSAGIAEPPLPFGNLRYPVYVVEEDSEPLTWSQGGDIDLDLRPGVPFNFGINIPESWENPQAFYTLHTPAYVLEDEALRRVGNTASYQISPNALAATFPNIETDNTGAGPAGADVLTLTFVVTGNDPVDGDLLIRTRTFYLFYDRLLSR